MAMALALPPATAKATRADPIFGTVPAGTRVRFHLTAPVSSNESVSGQAFAFVLLAPVAIEGGDTAETGAVGAGTVYLAGHAGPNGHEGDLTLRLDSLRTREGRDLLFTDQRFEINGRNRKIAAGALGLVPFVGIGARFIRGSELRVDASTPLETVLLRPATVLGEASASPTPAPSPVPPSPTVTSRSRARAVFQ